MTTAKTGTLLYLLDLSSVTSTDQIRAFVGHEVYRQSVLERCLRPLLRGWQAIRLVVVVSAPHLVADITDDVARLARKLGPVDASIDPVVSTSHFGRESAASGGPFDGVVIHEGLALVEDWQDEQQVAGNSLVRQDLRSIAEIVSFAKGLRQTVTEDAAASRARAHLVRLSPITTERPDGARPAIRTAQVCDMATDAGAVSIAFARRLHKAASHRSLDGPVSRLITRRLSPWISRPLARLGVHPNYVTLAAASLGLVALWLFAHPAPGFLAWGGIFWFASDVLDEVDGEVARLQAKQSTFGAWLDLTIDRIMDGAILVALAWPVIANTVEPLTLLGIFAVVIAVTCSSYTGLLYDTWMKNTLGRSVYFRIGRDTRNFVIVLGAILGLRIEVLWGAGLLALIEIARRLFICWRYERTMG